MRNYLSFGGGVNSVALYLYLLDQGVEFEAVFVDHGGDWPETYEYVDMFRQQYPITVLRPQRRSTPPGQSDSVVFDSIVDFCFARKMVPHRARRWCTSDFKVKVIQTYIEKPCFNFLGIDAGESHRAKIVNRNGEELRYPLIEADIDRDGCKALIKKHNLPIPIKSGCYICPFQRVGQLRELRRKHPELFCKLERLEDRNNAERERLGKEPAYNFKKPVRVIAEKGIEQSKIWQEDEYPPCECGL